MRLRSTLVLFVVVVAVVVALGALADEPSVAVLRPPQLVPAAKPWNAIVEISRHGRRLDGFRPVLTITANGRNESFDGQEVAPGRYRVEVVFPYPGRFSYTVTVPSGPSAGGYVTAFVAR